MFPFLGGLASGALGLVGSMMNSSAQNNINQQMLQMQQNQNQWTNSEWQQSFAAANAQNQFSNAFNTAQYDEQDWLARNGISARVADARAAGINPLAALGNPGIGSPSVSVGGGNIPSPSSGGVPNLTAAQPGTGFSAFGQDLGRALQAMQDPEDRAVAAEKTRQDLEKGDLENELLKTQIMGSSAAVHAPNGPGLRRDPAVVPEVQVARGPDGTETSGPTRAIEGWSWMDPWAKTQWMWRNQIEPAFGYNIPKAVTPAAPGYSKYKNPLTGGFYDFPSFNDLYKRFYSGSSTYSRQPGDISP